MEEVSSVRPCQFRYWKELQLINTRKKASILQAADVVSSSLVEDPPTTFRADTDISLIKKTLVCKICLFLTNSEQELGCHSCSAVDTSSAIQFKCFHCFELFPSSFHLRTHFNEKHDEHVNLIVCNKWHKSVNLLKELNLHSKSFEECKLKCGTCQRRYNSNFELMRHIRVHHDQSVGFACSGCTKRFQSALGLVVHFTIQHSDKLPYKCDKCHSTFAHPYSLKDHQKRAACSIIHLPWMSKDL